jgi:hypothetical protein
MLSQLRFGQIVTFVSNGNVITRNTTMADIIPINKKHHDEASALAAEAHARGKIVTFGILALFFLIQNGFGQKH